MECRCVAYRVFLLTYYFLEFVLFRWNCHSRSSLKNGAGSRRGQLQGGESGHHRNIYQVQLQLLPGAAFYFPSISITLVVVVSAGTRYILFA